jgi:hypothetical protein
VVVVLVWFGFVVVVFVGGWLWCWFAFAGVFVGFVGVGGLVVFQQRLAAYLRLD